MKRELREYDHVALKPEDLDGQINLTQIFGRDAPLHIEVGSGKGTFLVHQAQAQPEVNFLGIEWANKFYRHAADRIGRWGLTNVRIIRTDAVTFLQQFIPPEAVDCFHVYFPDPWPKKRHHKRRFLQQANVETLIRCLKPGGDIRIATDHAEYFQQIKEVMAANRAHLAEIDLPRPAGAEETEVTGTNYERKYRRENRPIFSLAVRRRAGPTA